MFWRKKKTEQNTKEILKAIQELRLDVNARFQEVKAMIQDNSLNIKDLDNKLFSKDLKDKQMYGMLHYKLHEVKPKED
jgi:hypothetical protein